MALSVVKGSFTWRTTTGDTVISGLTSPKAIYLWTTGGQTAAGAVTNQSTRWSQGFGTYRGSAVQQTYNSCWMTDANTSAIYGSDVDDNAILTRLASDTTRDAVYVLSSMDSTSVTLNCSDASAAAVIVHYLVLGGDDITDAEAHMFRWDSASPDVALGSGFGNPGDGGDPFLWLFSMASNTAAGGAIAGTDIHTGFSAVRSATERAALLFGGDDGGGNMNTALWAKDRALLGFTAAMGTADGEADIDTSGHPTDGYQLAYPDSPTLNRNVCALALRGTFQAQIGRQATRTSTGDQDIAQSFPEELRGCVFFGHSEPGSTSVITSGTTLAQIFIGATDLTTEGASGFGDDDGLGFNNSLLVTSTTQAVQCYGHTGSENGSDHLYSADVSENSTNVRLNYTTANGTAREFAYLFLYDAPAGGTTFDQDVFANATVTATAQRQANKKVNATATSTATVSRLISKNVTATSTSTASVVKKALKNITANATSSATIATVKVKIQALTATVTSSATIQRQVSKLVNATATSTATIRKTVTKALTVTLPAATASIATIKVKLQALTATVTSTATMQRLVTKPLSATVTSLATIQKQVSKRLTATVTSTATVQAIKVVLKALTATVTSTATIARQLTLGRVLTATVSSTASITKQVTKTLTASVTSVASMVADFLLGGIVTRLPRIRSRNRGNLSTMRAGSLGSSELDNSIGLSEAGNISSDTHGTMGADNE